ncbi:unnamed protein product [Heligmosomoides polygyrus]|uniref:Uncharacterized protein n=1 Tax=Heligmosomoides polygyrus TaxID=6339 RepID=A0A3P8FG91_HELPZ|nr:unnamed protein product [Heligmosomoides polygyrus]
MEAEEHPEAEENPEAEKEREHFDLPPELQPIFPLQPPSAVERKLEDIWEKVSKIVFRLATSVKEMLADIEEKVERIELRKLNVSIPNTGYGVDVPPMRNSKYHHPQPPPSP